MRAALRAAGCICVPVLVASLVACSDGPDETTAGRARFVVRFVEDDGRPAESRIEGVGDFARAQMIDTAYVDGRPVIERMTLGNVTYTRRVGEEHWDKGQEATTPEAKALVSVRNGLFDPSRSVAHLRAVSTDVTAAGTEKVRGRRTTHYRATVDLGRTAGAPGYLLPLEAWIDSAGRTRRLRYGQLGDQEAKVVWELYDYGVAVDLTPPPPDKVR